MKHMKRMCLFLCLTLFTGLVHASGMTSWAQDMRAHEHTQHNTDQPNDCHAQSEHTHNPQDSSQCGTEHYQCCLALVIMPSLSTHVAPIIVETFMQPPSPWALSLQGHAIYKPPKYVSKQAL